MQEKENKFDLEIRSMLSDATEEVPSGAWEAVSSRLDALAGPKKRPAPVWWRYAAAGFAAAAALVIAFVLPWRNNSTDQNIFASSDGADRIAVVAPESAEPAGSAVPEAFFRSPSSRKTDKHSILLSAGNGLVAMVECPSMKELIPPRSRSFGVISEESASATRGGSASRKTPQEELNEFIFREMNKTKSYRPSLGALSAGGMVATNGSASSIGAGLFRASAAPVLTTGIKELSKESSYAIPVSFALGAKFGITERFSVGTGLSFSLLTRSFTGSYTEVENNVVVRSITSADITNIQQYLGIPVTLYYDVIHTSPVRVYTYATGMVERNVLNRYNIHGTSDNLVYRESPKGVQWSAGVGLGTEFRLGGGVGLYIDPSLRYYFDCKQPRSIRTQQPLTLNLEIGLRYNFGKK